MMGNSKRALSIFTFAVIIMALIASGGQAFGKRSPIKRQDVVHNNRMSLALSDGSTEMVSVASDGTQGNDYSGWPSISEDGRFVAFWSQASNLVGEDTNSFDDIFVHDRMSGNTERVSVASDGTQGNGDAFYQMDISDDGRYISFSSGSNNLIDGDTNGSGDVFVHDRQTGITNRVSVASDGTQGDWGSGYSSISSGGRYVAFQSSASNFTSDDDYSSNDIFVHDRMTGATEHVSISSNGIHGNDDSTQPSISGDGRYIAFQSDASNLVNNDTNNMMDIFVHDRDSNQTTLVSLRSDGTQFGIHSMVPNISSDGRFVTFAAFSGAVYRHDRITGQTVLGSVNDPYFPSISGDGRYVTYLAREEDNSGCDSSNPPDIFVRDMITGFVACVSKSGKGESANTSSYYSSISNNGEFIAFSSFADNLVTDDINGQTDIFVHKFLSSISGQITYSDNSANQSVIISAGAGLTASTDSNGQYSLDLLPPGDYTLTPSKPNHSFSPASIDITVPADSIGVDFVGGLSLSGTLIYGDGSPIESADIYKDAELISSTDGNGEYTLEYLSPGTYTITPSRSGFQFSPNSQAITIPPNASSVDFSGGLSITGTARHGDDSPIDGMTINAGPALDTVTNSSGIYEFEFLAPGSYTLTPSKSGYSFSPPSRELTLPPSASVVDFQGGLTISGKVTKSDETPIADVSVSNGVGDIEITDSSGEYQFEYQPPGTYTVTPTKSNYAFSPASLEVNLPPNADDVDFTGTQLCYISGSVLDTEGKPIPGVNLSDGAGHFSQTDAQGEFDLNDLLPGTYQVEPTKAGYAFTPASLEITVPPDVDDLEYVGRISYRPVFLPFVCK